MRQEYEDAWLFTGVRSVWLSFITTLFSIILKKQPNSQRRLPSLQGWLTLYLVSSWDSERAFSTQCHEQCKSIITPNISTPKIAQSPTFSRDSVNAVEWIKTWIATRHITCYYEKNWASEDLVLALLLTYYVALGHSLVPSGPQWPHI